MALITLSDISKDLRDQNQIFEESLGNQERLLSVLVDQGKKRDTLDNLEKNRENQADGGKSPTTLDKLEKSRESKPTSGGLLDGLSGAGLLGTGAMIGSGLLKRGIPAAIAVTMADEIGDYVTSQTGSQELGDAVERGLVAGGIGSLFGKRIGIISGLFGAALTEENQKKLKELGDNLKPHVDELKTNVENLIGTTLPTSEQVLTGVEKTFGNAITGLSQLVTGDFKGLTSNLDDIALSAAGLYALVSPKGAATMALKAIKAPFVATTTAIKSAVGVGAGTQAAKAANAAAGTGTVKGKQVVKTKAGKLAYAGADGKATTNLVDAKDAKKFKPAVDIGKFPKLGKFMKLIKGGGPLAALIGAADIGMILASPGSIDDKVGQLGGAFGSALGGLSGGALGAMLGAIGGPIGSIAGGATLGIVGALGGDVLGMALAQYLFGKKVDAFGFGFGWINDLINGASNNDTTPTPSTAIQSGGSGGEFGGVLPQPTVSKPTPTTGTTVAQSNAATKATASTNIVNAPTTNTSIGQSSTAFVGSGTNSFDMNNPNAVRAMERRLTN